MPFLHLFHVCWKGKLFACDHEDGFPTERLCEAYCVLKVNKLVFANGSIHDQPVFAGLGNLFSYFMFFIVHYAPHLSEQRCPDIAAELNSLQKGYASQRLRVFQMFGKFFYPLKCRIGNCSRVLVWKDE